MSLRMMFIVALGALALFSGSHASAQGRGNANTEPLPAGQTNDPFPQPIARDEGVIRVTLREFASLPDIAGVAARMMTLVEEPTSRRLFVSDMRGPLYALSADGKTVTPYLDISDPKWGVAVQSQGRERGMQSFVLHPQFAQAGTPGFGKLYTYTDSSNQTPAPDFTTPNEKSTHDTVLFEWTTKTPSAATYDGEAPRELIRLRQPFANHNGGMIAFNPTARPGAADFGLLYVGIGDGGSGGDPMSARAESQLGLRQDFPNRPARQERPRRQVRHPRRESVRVEGAGPAGNLRLWRPQFAALRLGSQERRDVHVRHRPEHRRGSEPGHRRRQPRLERVGGQLPVRQPAGGDHGIAAQRSERDLSDRRMGPARSDPAAQQLLRLRRRGCLPEHHDPAAQQPVAVRRHAERRVVSRECRQASRQAARMRSAACSS